MDRDDPISHFFPDEENVNLYEVLELQSKATTDDIKKAYRRLALRYHPDKHASMTEQKRSEATIKFQQIGFAYAILSDDKRRSRYDKTGRTDEGLGLEPGEDGWETYFADLFDSVTRVKLDEMKKDYQGSVYEIQDIKMAYLGNDGTIGEVINHVPHSGFEDEARFIKIISRLIEEGELPRAVLWDQSVKDQKAKLVRQKQAEKEAGEAEELAKELGVWEEFYGSGKAGKRKAKGKQTSGEHDTDDGDVSALQALILKKQKSRGADLIESLAAKYEDPAPKGGKGKKRANDSDQKGKGKRAKADPPPDIDDEEFEKLQQKLFGGKDKNTKVAATETPESKGRGSKSRRL